MSERDVSQLVELGRTRGFTHVGPVERSCERWRVEAYNPTTDVRIIACHSTLPARAVKALRNVLAALPQKEKSE